MSRPCDPPQTFVMGGFDVDRLTAIIESRMSRDLAWLRDDGKTVDRWGPEQVAAGLVHLYLTGDVVSGLPAIEAEAAAGSGSLCPAGCGCRLGTEDADRDECACDGPCTQPAGSGSLDVERLAEALRDTFNGKPPGWESPPDARYQQRAEVAFRHLANDIAAEYARLLRERER